MPLPKKRIDLGLYVLNPDHTTRKVMDTLVWAEWLEKHWKDKVVKQDHVGPFLISTVFLGIDHNYASLVWKKGHPHLFETMIFDESKEVEVLGKKIHKELNYQERCSTWEEAQAQHARAVNMIEERVNAGIDEGSDTGEVHHDGGSGE